MCCLHIFLKKERVRKKEMKDVSSNYESGSKGGRACVNIHDSCCHQRPHGSPGSELQSVTLLAYKGQDATKDHVWVHGAARVGVDFCGSS